MPSVFNDFCEMREGRKALIPLSPLKISVYWLFTKKYFRQWTFFQYLFLSFFQYQIISDVIWSEYLSLSIPFTLTFRVLNPERDLEWSWVVYLQPFISLKPALCTHAEFSFIHDHLCVGAGLYNDTCIERKHSF